MCERPTIQISRKPVTSATPPLTRLSISRCFPVKFAINERSAGSVACAVSHAESRESGRAGCSVRVSYGEEPWEARGHGATTHHGDRDELLPCVSTPFSGAGANALTRHRLHHILNLVFKKRHMQVRPTNIAPRVVQILSNRNVEAINEEQTEN